MKDLLGQRFGYLTVLRREGSQNRKATWRCLCDCGKEVVMQSQSLRSNLRPQPKSCGCRQGKWNRTHGMAGTRRHRIWNGLKQRCLNPNSPDYPNYGGRGIGVCEEWVNSFETFYEDTKHGYSDTLCIERIDNSKGYSKGNCRWATVKEQGANTRVNRLITTPHGVLTLAQAAELYGLLPVTIHARLNRYGFHPLKAVLTPARGCAMSSTQAQGIALLSEDERDRYL